MNMSRSRRLPDGLTRFGASAGWHTFVTMRQFVRGCATLDGQKALLAHSLGNMVACEALRQGLRAGKYLMFNAAVAGEAVDGPFFRSVRIAPNPAGLRRIRAKAPSPKGVIGADFDFANGAAKGRIVLPEGMTGVFEWNGTRQALHSGENTVSAECGE